MKRRLTVRLSKSSKKQVRATTNRSLGLCMATIYLLHNFNIILVVFDTKRRYYKIICVICVIDYIIQYYLYYIYNT